MGLFSLAARIVPVENLLNSALTGPGGLSRRLRSPVEWRQRERERLKLHRHDVFGTDNRSPMRAVRQLGLAGADFDEPGFGPRELNNGGLTTTA
ncbi:MAG: hypothetical protein QOJ42_783 [Acidobacteriaceae bacterium]|jgi:hypothetical protein|nr:hypothetical protein [Acidobacteriaceae bacterium]